MRSTLTLLTAGTTARAQGTTSAFETRPFVGAYIPTGDQRDVLRDAVLVGGQLSWVALPELAFTGTFGWSPSLVDGSPGLVIAPRGRLIRALVFSFSGEKISSIEVVGDPARLRRLSVALPDAIT